MKLDDLSQQFLIRIYELADGHADRPVETASFGFEHGLTFIQTNAIIESLVGGGFIQVHTPTHVKLTRQGVGEVIRILRTPAKRVVEDVVPRSGPAPMPTGTLFPTGQLGRPRVVFISHLSEHYDLARVIKQQLEHAFGEPLRVFTSSDLYNFPGNTKWEERVRKVTKSLSVHYLLCNEKTLLTAWIHFEAGASWLQGKPIIPLCFGRISKKDLPPPYDGSEALDMGIDFADKIMTDLEKRLGSDYPATRDPDLFMDALNVVLRRM